MGRGKGTPNSAVEKRLHAHKKYDYIDAYYRKPTSTNSIWNFPAGTDFQYGVNSFSIRSGSENCVYIEYEANHCSSGWTTCKTFEDFRRIFDAFAVSCFDPDLLVDGLQSLSFAKVEVPLGD